MNGYNLIRDWYSFRFENTYRVKSVHSEMYCYIVDRWNRLGQKKEFGLPTTVTMEALGIGSYNTYKKALQSLIEFGFVELIKESKNQHTSKIIALSKNDKASDKALDKANAIASDKASDDTHDKASDTIDKLINNKTIKQLNQETIKDLDLQSKEKLIFLKNKLVKLFPDEIVLKKEFSQEVENCLSECLKYFDNHLHPETKARESWLDTIEKLNRIDNIPFEKIIEIVAWARNDDFWSGVFLSIPKLRTKDKNGLKYIVSFNEKMKKNGTNKGNSSQTGGATDEYRLKVARKLGLTEQG